MRPFAYLLFFVLIAVLAVVAAIRNSPASAIRAEAKFQRDPEATGADVPLTPSEVAVLRMPPTDGTLTAGVPPRPGTLDPNHDPKPRAHAALAAALLANEVAGAVRLTSTGDGAALHALPLAATPAWPAGSWEERLYAASRRDDARDGIDAAQLIAHALKYARRPEEVALADLGAALCARGVLAVSREGALHEWRAQRSEPVLVRTPAGAARLRDVADDAAGTLAAQCARARPEVWAALTDAVTRAFHARKDFRT